MLGQPYEFVGLMDHLQDRGLLDTGEYFVVGVLPGQYDPLNPQYYFQGINITTTELWHNISYKTVCLPSAV